MNILFHFLFNYVIISLIYGQRPELIPLIAFFSVALDLDHLPYIIKNYTSLIRYLRFGSVSRSRSHELFGLAIISSIIFFVSLFYKRLIILQIILLCIILHYMVDFLIGYTRPFFPYSDKEIFFRLYSTRKQRVLIEVISTIIAGVIFWHILF